MEIDLDTKPWKYIDATGNCWLWTASVDGKGYGKVSVNGRLQGAHRVTYELLVGPIPKGLELDHLCRIRTCVNPDHLEPVTHAENLRRGTIHSHNRIKTHCPHGHPYSGENLAIYNNGRYCRTCYRARHRAAYHRNKEAS